MRFTVRLRAGAVILGLLVVAGAAASSASAYGDARVLFSFQDSRIGESSGVVPSSYRDDLFLTHNDSGDLARFFAVDTKGCTLATYSLSGFGEEFREGHDVEDIARSRRSATDPTSIIWLADIGDNFHQRGEIYIHAVEEPRVNSSAGRATDTCPTPAEEVVPATTYTLAYPDHPHDAETLLADPVSGQLFIVTKTPFGQASIYAAPNPLSPDVPNELELVTSIAFPPSSTYDRDPATYVDPLLGSTPDRPYAQPAFDVQGRLSTTGGDIAPDRSRLVIRTYTDAWEWVLGDQSLFDALLAVPTQLPLEYQRQGEAITYTRDSRSLLTTCEDVACPAHLYAGP